MQEWWCVPRGGVQAGIPGPVVHPVHPGTPARHPHHSSDQRVCCTSPVPEKDVLGSEVFLGLGKETWRVTLLRVVTVLREAGAGGKAA